MALLTRRGGRGWRAAAAVLLAAASAAVPTQGLRAQAGAAPETECCVLLLVPVGARASSLGGSVGARTGADAAFVNPAGVAGLPSSTFVVHHSDMSLGAQIDAFSLLLRLFSSTVGVSYQLFDKGDITTTDGAGQPIGELSYRDHLLVTTFATGLGGGLSVGLSYKFFQQRVDCTGACGGDQSVASTHGVDLGARYNPHWHSALELGISAVNLGGALDVGASSESFPARLRVAAAYDLLDAIRRERFVAVRVLLDVQDRLRDLGDPVTSVGMEIDLQRTIFLRAGYAPGEGLGTGAAVGVELRYDRFDIAVARSFVNSTLEPDSEPFQISFGLNF